MTALGGEEAADGRLHRRLRLGLRELIFVVIHRGVRGGYDALHAVTGMPLGYSHCRFDTDFERLLAIAFFQRVFSEDPLANAIRVNPGAGRIAGQQDNEFISAPASDDVAGARDGLQLGRKLAEQLIAGEMTVAVIDLLETVEVEHDDAEGLAVGDVALDPLFDTASIGDAGQLILEDQVLDFSQTGLILRYLGVEPGDQVLIIPIHAVDAVLEFRDAPNERRANFGEIVEDRNGLETYGKLAELAGLALCLIADGFRSFGEGDEELFHLSRFGLEVLGGSGAPFLELNFQLALSPLDRLFRRIDGEPAFQTLKTLFEVDAGAGATLHGIFADGQQRGAIVFGDSRLGVGIFDFGGSEGCFLVEKFLE
jgi:hypothetical protein